MTDIPLPADGDTSWSDWGDEQETLSDVVAAATDAATAVTLVKRDAAGRFKAVDGSAASDVVTKGQLDAGSTADRARGNHTGTQAISTVTGLQTALDAKAPLASPTFTGTVGGITKSMVGLGSVDNTADTAKPVSTAQQTALDLKANTLSTTTTQTGTTYTFVLGDAGTIVEGNNASAQTYTVPPNSSVAFPVGTSIVVRQYGAGQITLAAGVGVTLRSRGAALKLAGQYAELTATKRATDEWVISGDVTT